MSVHKEKAYYCRILLSTGSDGYYHYLPLSYYQPALIIELGTKNFILPI